MRPTDPSKGSGARLDSLDSRADHLVETRSARLDRHRVELFQILHRQRFPSVVPTGPPVMRPVISFSDLFPLQWQPALNLDTYAYCPDLWKS
jgi:hypothetical protein